MGMKNASLSVTQGYELRSFHTYLGSREMTYYTDENIIYLGGDMIQIDGSYGEGAVRY
jgi:hypothetical protein